MNNLKIHEWQEMELKKDVEIILKEVQRKERTTLALCCEAILAAIAIIWNFFSECAQTNIILVIILIISAVFPILIIMPNLCQYVRASLRINRNGRDVQKFIDEFDNKVCYWVMVGKGYLEMIQNKRNLLEENIFYLQEANFYINKALKAIGGMSMSIKSIFTEDADDVIEYGKIDIYRLKVIVDNLGELREQCDKLLEKPDYNCIAKNQKEINKKYDCEMYSFIELFKTAGFNIELVWRKLLT